MGVLTSVADREEEVKLNVGCGFDRKEGYVHIDSDYRIGPDIVRDIERGMPYGDNTVDEIFTSHTLEHINPDQIHYVMFEFWRILKNGAQLQVIVPIGKGLTNSPEHKCFFDYRSTLFFTDWNLREPYKFKLVNEEVVGQDITEELHFVLEAVK